MRVAEERLNAGFAGQCLMLSELAAVVEGDGMPGGLGQTVEYISQHIAGFRRRFGLQGGRDEEPRHAFAEREQVAPLGAELHKVAFPMAEFLAVFRAFRPVVNGAPVCDGQTVALEIAPAPACLGPGQVAVQLLLPDFRAIDVAVDRLMADRVF